MVAGKTFTVSGWCALALATALSACGSGHSNGMPGTGGAGGSMIGGSGGGAGTTGGAGTGGTGSGGTGGAKTGGECNVELHAPPTAGTDTGCAVDPLFCPPNNGECSGMNPSIVTGSCDGHTFWRKTTGPEFYTVQECVYDAGGTVVGQRLCTDSGCQYHGIYFDVSTCGDGGVGADLCHPDGGTDAAVGWTTCENTPAETPPPSTPLTPTVCASPAGCTATAISYTGGTCGAYLYWQRSTGFELTECIFNAANLLVGERRCTDTGCQCRGTHVDVSACADAGTTHSCVDGAAH
jgi:hypothetical protein